MLFSLHPQSHWPNVPDTARTAPAPQARGTCCGLISASVSNRQTDQVTAKYTKSPRCTRAVKPAPPSRASLRADGIT